MYCFGVQHTESYSAELLVVKKNVITVDNVAYGQLKENVEIMHMK
jgi:hypothetical protein